MGNVVLYERLKAGLEVLGRGKRQQQYAKELPTLENALTKQADELRC